MSELRARDITLRYASREALRAVHCELHAGELLGIIGPNGAGKSTLMRALAGVVEPDSGEIELDGRLLRQWSPFERAQRLAYLPQSATLHWPLSVAAVVELGRLPFRRGWFDADEDGERSVREAMEAAEVTPFRERLVTELSGGERARVMIARMLAGNPRVMLADEPVAALDAFHQLQVMDLLQSRAREGAAIAVVLHDLGLAARYCDRILLLDAGRVAKFSSSDEVLLPEILEPVYGVGIRIAEVEGIRTIVPLARHGSRIFG